MLRMKSVTVQKILLFLKFLTYYDSYIYDMQEKHNFR